MSNCRTRADTFLHIVQTIHILPIYLHIFPTLVSNMMPAYHRPPLLFFDFTYSTKKMTRSNDSLLVSDQTFIHSNTKPNKKK